MKIVVDSQLIEYSDVGSGCVVLLLHGWGTGLKNFDELSLYLSKKFRVISFDFPGFGGSPMPSSDWHVADYAKITAELLKKLKVDELYAVIGHSFGGRVIIKGISSELLAPQKVVLMGSAGIKPKKTAKKIAYKTIASVGKAALSLPVVRKYSSGVKKRFYSQIGGDDYINSGKLKGIFLNTINEDLLPLVGSIKQPSLLIWGENDTETPVDDARKMMSKLKNAKLVIIPDAGHFVHADQSEKVMKELDGFLI